jgi:hypothetical protein
MLRQLKLKPILAALFAWMWFSMAAFAQDPDPAPLFGSQTIDDPGMTYNSDPAMTNSDPPPAPGGGTGGSDPGVPVDGGLSLLLAAGAAYGARKLRRTAPKQTSSLAEDAPDA